MAATTAPDGRAGHQVGRSLHRLEAREKVSGRAEYTHLMQLPGMLHAKIFRSTVAHGRIKSIDVSGAREVPGVYAVYTSEDVLKVIPDPYYGPAFHDQPILAVGKVHYIGEPVAVVLAADPHVAEHATQQIVAEYHELPAVFDEVEAAQNKTLVHEELRPAGTFADLKHLKGRRGTNIALDFRLRRGDVDKAFAAAAQVFEHTFRTQKVLHLALEPYASIADFRDDGVTIYSAAQGPSFVRTEIARLLRWPENRVRIKVPYLGGGYGGKLYIKMEALATAMSMLAHRPVKVALTMEEQFYTITKHPATLRIKSGIDKDGRIIARKCEVWWNGGAYADIGPRVTQKSGFTASGPYDIDNVAIDSYALYTNLTPAGALRGFGIPQLVWAYESHTDMIARALKRDPLEFRKQNLLRNGRPQATGTILKDAAIEKVLDRIADRLNWKQPVDHGTGTVRRGRGLAVALKAVISPTTSVAIVNISGDGSTTLYCGTVDMGQGSDTAMAQIVGEVLDMPAESVRIVPRDTDVTPYDMGTLGSRSLFHMGHAVRLAAEEARSKVAALRRELGEPDGSNAPLAELFLKKYGMQAGNIVGTGTYKPDYIPPDASGLTTNATPFWMVAGSGVEIEVDTETGHVRVTRLINVADVGKPINPKIVETQLSGASLMQLGFSMFEKMHIDGGQITNASLADYKIPGMHDVPRVMENETVDAIQENGPFGAKGVGELATFGVSPAIANAIDDAVGVRLTELPLTPEAVFRALRAKANKPLGRE
ncbi:MAG TPA: xanthine dehydrogenase family protein molybdopterin-binding subunit [Xanthobacteraceae bacterium]|nr:xanthine dehydrogenase family protein molybdopterin-binding subunit [Xanthobacteraceae bacterium]